MSSQATKLLATPFSLRIPPKLHDPGRLVPPKKNGRATANTSPKRFSPNCAPSRAILARRFTSVASATNAKFLSNLFGVLWTTFTFSQGSISKQPSWPKKPPPSSRSTTLAPGTMKLFFRIAHPEQVLQQRSRKPAGFSLRSQSGYHASVGFSTRESTLRYAHGCNRVPQSDLHRAPAAEAPVNCQIKNSITVRGSFAPPFNRSSASCNAFNPSSNLSFEIFLAHCNAKSACS